MRNPIVIAMGILLLITVEAGLALDSDAVVRKRVQCAAEFGLSHPLTQQCYKAVIRHYCDKMYYPKYLYRCKALYNAAKLDDLSYLYETKSIRLMLSCVNVALFKDRIDRQYQAYRKNVCKLKPKKYRARYDEYR